MNPMDLEIANELYEMTKQFGAPSWEEFRKNPDRFRSGETDEELFGVIDGAGEQLKPSLKKVRYKCLGYECDTLEQVRRIVSSEGLRMIDLDWEPHVISAGTEGKLDILLIIKRKVQDERPSIAGS